jgi:hypothetical protein
MSEKRLGELTEQELTELISRIFGEKFDQVPASEFFGTLQAMGKATPPAHAMVKWPFERDEETRDNSC